MILFPLSISILDAHATIENHIELRIKLVATVDTMIVEFLDAVLHMHRVRIMTADYVLVAVLFAYHGSRPMHQSNRTKAIVHASENMNTAFKSYAHYCQMLAKIMCHLSDNIYNLYRFLSKKSPFHLNLHTTAAIELVFEYNAYDEEKKQRQAFLYT